MEKQYTEAQQKAIEWNEGAVLVLAGPGSGKTAVLTERIRRLLEESKGSSFKILALTFTNKAAQEMQDRILAGLDVDQQRLFIGTFHSFCSEVLRSHGSYVGVKSNFAIYTSNDDLNAVLKDICRAYKNKVDPSFPGDRFILLNVIRHFERKLCFTEEEITAALPRNTYAEAFKWIYMEYLRVMLANSTLDFDLLILLVYRLFKTRANIARLYRKVYRYINVDEFQDTNYGQYMLLTSLCGKENKNIFIVADDDQVIYGWNGADHKRIREFKEEYQAEIIQLNKNFRCPKDVVAVANRLISHNSGRELNKKPLEAMKEDEGGCKHIKCTKFGDEDQEIAWIVEQIRYIQKQDAQASIGVLARNNKLLEHAFENVQVEGISCEKTKRKNDFETPYILWLYLILKLANHRTDNIVFKQVIDIMLAGINVPIDAEKVSLDAALLDGDYLKALRDNCNGLFNDREFEQSFSLNLVEGRNFQKFIKDAFAWAERQLNKIEEENYKDHMLEEYRIEKKVWTEFERYLAGRGNVNDLILSMYIQEFSMFSKEEEPKPGAVQFLTIHASKGKEFDYVFLLGMVNDELPSFHSIKKGMKSAEMEEERRNCFVAITRTKKLLYLSYADLYYGWRKMPSIFLGEMQLDEGAAVI